MSEVENEKNEVVATSDVVENKDTVVKNITVEPEEKQQEDLIPKEDIDFLINNLFNELPKDGEKIRPTFNDNKDEVIRPTFNDNKQDDEIEDISEEEIAEIESHVDEMIKELDEANNKIDELTSIISNKDTELELKINEINEKVSEIDMLKKAIDTLWEHEVLWPLAKKIFSWENVDIPNFLKEYVSNDKSLIPNMDNLSNVWIQKKSKNPTMDDYVINIGKFNKFKI